MPEKYIFLESLKKTNVNVSLKMCFNYMNFREK